MCDTAFTKTPDLNSQIENDTVKNKIKYDKKKTLTFFRFFFRK